MEQERTFIEKLIVAIVWLVLEGGCLGGLLVSKGIWESQMEMAFPQAVATFIGSIGGSVTVWAILIQIVRMSDKLRQIEKQLNEKKG